MLIHTADDLGPISPDYHFGWGLLNTHAAAELLRDYAGAPGSHRLLENRVTDAHMRDVWSVTVADGTAWRVTLCWPTRPAPHHGA